MWHHMGLASRGISGAVNVPEQAEAKAQTAREKGRDQLRPVTLKGRGLRGGLDCRSSEPASPTLNGLHGSRAVLLADRLHSRPSRSWRMASFRAQAMK